MSTKNRQKHLLHRSWFRVIINGRQRIVRPVISNVMFENGSDSVVCLVDENSDVVDIMSVESFNNKAVLLGSKGMK